MAAAEHDITIEQGATYYLIFTWYQESLVTPGTPGDPYDVTACIIRMQIRETQQGTIQWSGSTTNGKITHNGAGGKITVKITDDDTDLLTRKALRYDLEIEYTTGPKTGDVYRLLKGVVIVDPNYTQEVDDMVVT